MLSTQGAEPGTRGRRAAFVDSDAVESAREAGLRYVTDAMPGIRRQPRGDNFVYIDSDGFPIDDEHVLARIRSLAIPPAWTGVWISPTSRGHLQATGRDAKGRKQYRYHPRWREVRDANKYERMIAFAEALPSLRTRVSSALALPGLPREKVLATIVRLLDETDVRVGNQEYVRENDSFGLTTLQSQHAEVSGSHLRFSFRGKSGKEHTVAVQDRRVAKIVRRCQELPGFELFQYIDDEGNTRLVDSSDVNEYLREVTGQDFTAKDFRTWAGTTIAAHELKALGGFSSETQAKKKIAHAVKVAAEHLGNTPTICRKCYVHPSVIVSYIDGTLLQTEPGRKEVALTQRADGLHPEEGEVLALLHRLEREKRESAKAG